MAKIDAERLHAHPNVRARRDPSPRASHRHAGSPRTFGMGVVLTVACLLVYCGAIAQAPAAPGTTVSRDPRLPIALAAARRENWNCLMRGHFRSITESMRLLSEGEFEAAAAVVENHFSRKKTRSPPPSCRHRHRHKYARCSTRCMLRHASSSWTPERLRVAK